ncbi:hypothetical protein N8209_01445 [Gammaproteobacteria bacterium]|jgi:hypothetical protein|nr:hypothetical protein [Gammaproteobacteria bacterium]
MLLTMFMQRMGLDAHEAEKVNELTSIAQMAQSWIQLQAKLRAQGVPGKLTKGEAAISLMIGTIDASTSIDEDGILILLKGISAIFGYQYQENFCSKVEDVFRRPEVYNKVKDIVAKNEDLLELQYAQSLDLYNNRGFFEKLLS